MKYEIDETTGLPKLPEGYFWKVSKSAVEGWHKIEIRKRGWCYPFSKRQAYTIIDEALTEKVLKGQASYVFHDWNAKESNKAVAKDLRGSYPPKSLKGK